MQVTELQDTDVSRVSLVKRASTRLGWRITKGDDEVTLDLGSLVRKAFAVKKAEPAVIAVLVQKADTFTAGQMAALQKAGLVFTQKADLSDGVIQYSQPGSEADGLAQIVKFDGNVGLVVSGIKGLNSPLKKDFDTWRLDSTNFTEVLNTVGFYPGVCMATDALHSTVRNIMEDAQDASEAAGLIETAFDECKSWITGCVRGIPTQVFKAEVAYAKVHISNPGADAAAAAGQLGASDDSATLAGRQQVGAEPDAGAAATAQLAKTDVKKAADASSIDGAQSPSRPAGSGGKNTQIAGTGTAAVGTDTAKEPSPVEDAQDAGRTDTGHGGVNAQIAGTGSASIGTDTSRETETINTAQGGGAKPVTAAGGEMAQILKAMQDSMTATFTAGLAGIKKDVGDLKVTIDGVQSRMVKAEEALNGTVIMDAAGDPNDLRRTRKTETSAPPLLDTAYDRSHLSVVPAASRRISGG
jgi:hypothetical protein